MAVTSTARHCMWGRLLVHYPLDRSTLLAPTFADTCFHAETMVRCDSESKRARIAYMHSSAPRPNHAVLWIVTPHHGVDLAQTTYSEVIRGVIMTKDMRRSHQVGADPHGHDHQPCHPASAQLQHILGPHGMLAAARLNMAPSGCMVMAWLISC